MEQPIAQAAGHRNNIVKVYNDRVEFLSGWQGQNIETVNLREVENLEVRGWVNCTLNVRTNQGRVYQLERMALPDANSVKKAVERQKQKASAQS